MVQPHNRALCGRHLAAQCVDVHFLQRPKVCGMDAFSFFRDSIFLLLLQLQIISQPVASAKRNLTAVLAFTMEPYGF